MREKNKKTFMMNQTSWNLFKTFTSMKTTLKEPSMRTQSSQQKSRNHVLTQLDSLKSKCSDEQ